MNNNSETRFAIGLVLFVTITYIIGMSVFIYNDSKRNEQWEIISRQQREIRRLRQQVSVLSDSIYITQRDY